MGCLAPTHRPGSLRQSSRGLGSIGARSSPRRHRPTMERPIELGAERQNKRLHFVAGDRCGHHFSRKRLDFDWLRPHIIRRLRRNRAPAGFDRLARRRLSLLCRSSFVSRRAPLPRGRSLSRCGLPSFRRRRFHFCIRLVGSPQPNLDEKSTQSRRPMMVGSQHPPL